MMTVAKALLPLFFVLALSPSINAQSQPVTTTLEPESKPAVQVEPEVGEIRRGIVWDDSQKPRSVRFLERNLVNIEPELKGQPERLDTYLYFVESSLINDSRLILFDVKATWNAETSTVLLEGVAEFQQNINALVQSLQILGFQSIENNIELLPTDEFKATPIGVVIVPQTLVYNKPVKPRETMTDGIMGDAFFLMKSYDDMILAHAPDGYVCYISKSSVKPMSTEEYKNYLGNKFITTSVNIPFEEGTVTPGSTIALKDTGTHGDYILTAPDGREIAQYIPAYGSIIPQDESQASEAIRVAKTFLGTPYVWGGKSTTGVDCSGLVQSSYRALGYNLPRDAYMQAYMGRLSATPQTMDLLQKGDLLYFMGSTGRITHTAIYIENGTYIEAVGGGVKYTSFNAEDENFDEDHLESFCFAKRFVH